MGLLDLCEKYYQTRNLYEILEISETASDKEVKKAYHRMSLKVHPDRVAENEKLVATEKFKVLGSIHALLTDEHKRAIYDETKTVDDDDCTVIIDRDWTAYWRLLFKTITDEDIKAYEKEYTGSEMERKDLKQAYLNGKGNMDYICDHVQFARTENEARLREILNEMIKNDEIPAYNIFTNEPAKKRLRRIAREKREAKKAEQLASDIGPQGTDLEVMIKSNRNARAQQLDMLIEDLAAKYGKPKATRASKRQAAATAESKTKNKRRK